MSLNCRVPADHYVNSQESLELIRAWTEAYPSFIRGTTIGTSELGKPIVVMTISADISTADTKPAVWMDGLIHADEWSSTMVCLATAERLLDGLINNEKEILNLLSRSTYYILPVISPDGLDAAHEGEFLRSVPRKYGADRNLRYWKPVDMDKDRKIRQMRWVSRFGAWKRSKKYPDLLLPRAPTDVDGEFFHLMIEGIYAGNNGATIDRDACLTGVYWGPQHDLNRNWPANWIPDASGKRGSGDFPLSEPESRAVAEFFASHPNISIVNSNHTCGGGHLVALSFGGRGALSPRDRTRLQIFEDIAKRTTEYTMEWLDESLLKYFDTNTGNGVFDEYTAYVRGALAVTTEIWNLSHAAGIPAEQTGFIETHSQASIQERAELIYSWAREKLGDEGYAPWQPFNHPQLGDVEIGGMDFITLLVNPPVSLMKGEFEKNVKFNVELGKVLPKIEVSKVRTRELGPQTVEVTVSIGNSGYLSTAVTDLALKQHWFAPVRAELVGNATVRVVSENAIQEKEQIAGAEESTSTSWHSLTYVTPPAQVADFVWIVMKEQGVNTEPLVLKVTSQRGGCFETRIEI
jgi:hypothetical protein